MTEHSAPVPTSAASAPTPTASAPSRPRRQPAIVILGTALSLGTLGFGLVACNGDDTPGEASSAAFSNQSSAVSSPSASAGAGASASAMESTNPSPGGNQGGSPQSDAGSAATATLQAVSPESFGSSNGYFTFKASVAPNVNTECAFSPGHATCLGEPDASVPNLTGQFAGNRPGAVSLGAEGLSYTTFEGVPPARHTLETGQQDSDGPLTCQKPTDDRITCMSGSSRFTISGPDRRIDAIGPVVQY
ncbi:hypothetical protein [Corynebacterium heidelbergense]|uniref:hypothetical protein n=1 Tax=Corynebacterium heidelbergense TaxID=2055947 RepID=UPI00105826F1|nr:hypothetical protein [Corynebacterium heidelbergense]